MTVDVGQEVHAQPVPRRGQRIDDQPRAEVGAANAHADDVGDRTGMQRIDHLPHARLRLDRLRTRRAGVRCSRRIATQGRVQRGAAFGRVDRLAVEQATQCACQVRALADGEQRRQCIPVVALAGEAGVQRADPQREIARARRVFGIQPGNRGAGQPPRVRVQAGQQAHAACWGIDWLVWVMRLSRSTYRQVGLNLAASASSQWP